MDSPRHRVRAARNAALRRRLHEVTPAAAAHGVARRMGRVQGARVHVLRGGHVLQLLGRVLRLLLPRRLQPQHQRQPPAELRRLPEHAALVERYRRRGPVAAELPRGPHRPPEHHDPDVPRLRRGAALLDGGAHALAAVRVGVHLRHRGGRAAEPVPGGTKQPNDGPAEAGDAHGHGVHDCELRRAHRKPDRGRDHKLDGWKVLRRAGVHGGVSPRGHGVDSVCEVGADEEDGEGVEG